MRRGWAVVALLTMIVATGCSRTGGDEQTRSANQQGYPTVTGRVTQIPPDQRVVLPEVSGTALGGGTTTISSKSYAGKVLVINVWGSWCPPCRAEAPALESASRKTKDKAQFIGITVKDYSPAAAEAFVKQNKITYPSIFDPTGAVLLPLSGQFPPSAIPTTLIIDAQGRLAVRVLSEVTEITLVNMIDDVAAGK